MTSASATGSSRESRTSTTGSVTVLVWCRSPRFRLQGHDFQRLLVDWRPPRCWGDRKTSQYASQNASARITWVVQHFLLRSVHYTQRLLRNGSAFVKG